MSDMVRQRTIYVVFLPIALLLVVFLPIALLVVACAGLTGSWIQIGVHEALAKGLVEARVTGCGELEHLAVTLRSASSERLQVTIPSGTLFKAESKDTQDMV